MLNPKSFLYEERGGVAWVTLNRPERLNALTFEVYRELTDAFAALQAEDSVRVVVVTGAGRAFCSGGDVGDFITAEEALGFGLYNRVVPAEDLEAETRALAERLARGPAFALGVTKEMLNRELDVSLDTALEWEAQAQALCMQHPDYGEAYRAFTEKREPRFNRGANDREEQ